MISSTHFPLLEEAATSLHETGQYQAELSGQDLRNMIVAVIHGLQVRHAQVRAEVLALSVQIAASRGVVCGAVSLTSPLTATITPRIVLVNDPDPARVRLQDLQMQTEGGLFAKGMLGMLNIEGRTKTILQDPNRALVDLLAPELRSRGVVLTGVTLHFAEDVLNAHLEGHQA